MRAAAIAGQMLQVVRAVVRGERAVARLDVLGRLPVGVEGLQAGGQDAARGGGAFGRDEVGRSCVPDWRLGRWNLDGRRR